jgi:hypothetical protein
VKTARVTIMMETIREREREREIERKKSMQRKSAEKRFEDDKVRVREVEHRQKAPPEA